MPSRKKTALARRRRDSAPQERPLTEEDLDALACARMDQRIRTEKPIPIDQVLKEYGRRRPRVVGR